MITTMPPEELMSMGERYRADYLVEQGGYSLGIAAKDGKTLATYPGAMPIKLRLPQESLENISWMV
jgi:hypothetical protein